MHAIIQSCSSMRQEMKNRKSGANHRSNRKGQNKVTHPVERSFLRSRNFSNVHSTLDLRFHWKRDYLDGSLRPYLLEGVGASLIDFSSNNISKKMLKIILKRNYLFFKKIKYSFERYKSNSYEFVRKFFFPIWNCVYSLCLLSKMSQ